MLQLGTLVVGHGDRPVLEPVTTVVPPGSFVCLLGRNGTGKSTLLRTLAGLLPAMAGAAFIEGCDIAMLASSARARRIAVVLTERAGSPGLTVDDVLKLGRAPFTGWDGLLSRDDELIVGDAAAACGVSAFQPRLFDALSDGERQRVMIARAMAQTAQLMLLDEITAFLDLPGRVEMMALLRRHAQETGTVVLLSSHDLDLSLQLSDLVWLLPGQGRFVAGTAAQLIAAGEIGAAFDTPAVRFDPASGRFALHQGR